jgi:hypothetical protein
MDWSSIMTDHDDRRLDLRVLRAEHDPAREEAVIRRVLTRIQSTDRSQADAMVRLERIHRHMLMAAAGLATMAIVASLWAPRRVPANPVIDWAVARHVPTNGELLVTFTGYRP